MVSLSRAWSTRGPFGITAMSQRIVKAPVYRAALLVLLGLAVGCAVLNAGVWRTELSFAGPFARDTGYAYVVRKVYDGPLPSLLEAPSDDLGAPDSRLQLFQNGEPLPTPHAPHTDIRAIGDGRYSHWRQMLLFAPIGNVDPSAPGFRLHASTVVTVWWPVSLVIFVSLAILVACALPAIVSATKDRISRLMRAPPVMGVVQPLVTLARSAVGVLSLRSVRLLLCGLLLSGAGVWTFVLWSHASRYELPPSNYSSDDWPGYSRAVDPPLTGWDDPRLSRRHGESDLELAHRITMDVNRATYHCGTVYDTHWLSAAPLPLDFLRLKSKGVMSPKHLRCGWCGQRSYVAARALRDNGIDARTYGLYGHIVALVSIDGKSYIIDADYGVGPFAVDPTSSESMTRAADQAYRWVVEELDNEGRRFHYNAVLKAFDNVKRDAPYSSPALLDWLSAAHERVLDLADAAKPLLPFAAAIFLASGIVLTLWGFRQRREERLRPGS